MRRSDLAALVLLTALIVAPAAVAVREAQDGKRVTMCANNLSQLYKMQMNYMVQYGGPQKLMPVETGEAFWLKLSDRRIRLIDDSLLDLYQCPVENVDDGPGTCDYRGPAKNVNGASYGDGDPVGADVDGNHGTGRGGNVLRKSGDVQTCGASDSLWSLAAEKTIGGNAATPPRIRDDQEETPKQRQAVVVIAHLAIAVMMFNEFNGEMPRSLRDLVERPKDAKVWPDGGFYPGGRIPKDPWGNDYQYEPTKREPKVWTWGADGKEGGEGEDADLTIEDIFKGRGGKGAAPRLAANERNAAGSLKTVATAQADFRSNDRDNNRVQDFWTGDVAGLYCIDNSSVGGDSMIKLIEVSVALADYAPWTGGLTVMDVNNYSNPISKFGKRAPKAGYWFMAMKEDKQVTANGGNGDYRQHTGGAKEAVYNTSRFGVCAFPADYGKGGTRTFIINEGNTMFWKDTGGKPVEAWPTDEELARDWKKLD
ncbi:MAG: DUF2950 family protein [Planctomycetes bacterium]|nr:DUF2950 family protein [Planctomycetota bacterium]